MKILKIMLISLSASAFLACKENKVEPQIIEKTTIIEKEKEVEVPAPEKENGTSINIDKDGVEFSTKKGEKKTEIKINDNQQSVEVEK